MALTGWLFPGQGSQAVGMGRDLCDDHDVARRTFAEADEAVGFPLSKLCFEGPEEELRRTAVTQPAILTASVAAARVLEETGQAPGAVAGHSLGEYSALVCAGVLPFADAVRAVHQRGTFMQEAVPAGEGAMAALVGLDGPTVTELCAGIDSPESTVQPANLNAAGQVVIAGHAAAVARASDIAREKGARRVVPLNVSAPFHCRLMQPAADRLEKALADIPFADARVPVWVNVDAEPLTAGGDLRRALVRQVASPVRWEQTMAGWGGLRFGSLLEVGPGNVLGGLARRVEGLPRVQPAGTSAAISRLEP